MRTTAASGAAACSPAPQVGAATNARTCERPPAVWASPASFADACVASLLTRTPSPPAGTATGATPSPSPGAGGSGFSFSIPPHLPRALAPLPEDGREGVGAGEWWAHLRACPVACQPCMFDGDLLQVVLCHVRQSPPYACECVCRHDHSIQRHGGRRQFDLRVALNRRCSPSSGARRAGSSCGRSRRRQAGGRRRGGRATHAGRWPAPRGAGGGRSGAAASTVCRWLLTWHAGPTVLRRSCTSRWSSARARWLLTWHAGPTVPVQVLYIQMEFCPRTLGADLDAGPLDERDAWPILRGMLQGLAYIHSQVGGRPAHPAVHAPVEPPC